ncbi:MAG: YIP1 family protein [Candidatus Micrarchaeota archaeon]
MSDADEYVKKYLGYVDMCIGFIPFDRLKLWKEFFFNPASTVAKEKGGILERMVDLYVSSLIGIIIMIIAAFPNYILQSVIKGTDLAALALSIPLVIGIYLALWLVGPVLSFLYSLLVFAVAKLLGGVGDLRAHFNAYALPGLAVFVLFLPATILMVPLQWLGAIPLVNLCACLIILPLSIAGTILDLYGIYLSYLAFKEVHKLSSARAAAVVVLPVLLIAGIAIALVAIFYALLFAYFTAMVGAMTAAGAL